jgi:hypothetical protein
MSQADRAAGVVPQAWVHLGCQRRYHSRRLRLVCIGARGKRLMLITNLSPEALWAELVSQLYQKGWRIELFFRWIKCIWGCGHWLAQSQQGATLQIYLALIANGFQPAAVPASQRRCQQASGLGFCAHRN